MWAEKANRSVPHGRTPANQKLLFQSHREGPNATLLPESLEEAASGAEAFVDRFREIETVLLGLPVQHTKMLLPYA